MADSTIMIAVMLQLSFSQGVKNQLCEEMDIEGRLCIVLAEIETPLLVNATDVEYTAEINRHDHRSSLSLGDYNELQGRCRVPHKTAWD